MLRSLMIDHAAELLGVSRRTVYYRIREGRLRTIRTMGGTQRVLVESLLALMREDPGAYGGLSARSSGAAWAPARALLSPEARRPPVR
jgi:excisionase family DNA binding protein